MQVYVRRIKNLEKNQRFFGTLVRLNQLNSDAACDSMSSVQDVDCVYIPRLVSLSQSSESLKRRVNTVIAID